MTISQICLVPKLKPIKCKNITIIPETTLSLKTNPPSCENKLTITNENMKDNSMLNTIEIQNEFAKFLYNEIKDTKKITSSSLLVKNYINNISNSGSYINNNSISTKPNYSFCKLGGPKCSDKNVSNFLKKWKAAASVEKSL